MEKPQHVLLAREGAEFFEKKRNRIRQSSHSIQKTGQSYLAQAKGKSRTRKF
jgi:hypothetical protein